MSRVALLAVLLLAGCAVPFRVIDQRSSQGPTADEFWTAKIIAANGRQPTFEEKGYFEDEINTRIGRFLRENEVAASDVLTLQSFRYHHQVTAGMAKEQVELLLGPPFTTSTDPQQMANWARRHWPEIRGRADEAWGYPFGWIVYLDKGKVVDLTQYLAAPGKP